MKLLLTGAFNYNSEQLVKLASMGYEIVFVQDERTTLQIDVCDIRAVVCNALFQYNDISEFKKLEYIQLTSAGLDRVPLNYIKERNISLFNARGVYSIPMAEWAVHKVLDIYKRSSFFYQAQKERRWKKRRDLQELTGKTATIIGFGDVGTEVAKRLKPFGVNLIGVGRRIVSTELVDEFYRTEQLNEVLSRSDIVILTLPLTNETRHLLNAERIHHMKDNSVLINMSRGSIICEAALIKAIRNKKFLGVALDVFNEEPLPEESQIWSLDDVIITPHISYVSEQVASRLFGLIVDNLEKSGPLRRVVL